MAPLGGEHSSKYSNDKFIIQSKDDTTTKLDDDASKSDDDATKLDDRATKLDDDAIKLDYDNSKLEDQNVAETIKLDNPIVVKCTSTIGNKKPNWLHLSDGD